MRLRVSIAEYNANVRPCAIMAQAGGGRRVVREKQAPLCILKTRGSEETFGLARDPKESPGQIPHASVFYPQQLILLDSVVVYSYT